MERRRRGSEDAKKDRRDEATLLLLLMEADLIRDSILTRIVPYEDQRGILVHGPSFALTTRFVG